MLCSLHLLFVAPLCMPALLCSAKTLVLYSGDTGTFTMCLLCILLLSYAFCCSYVLVQVDQRLASPGTTPSPLDEWFAERTRSITNPTSFATSPDILHAAGCEAYDISSSSSSSADGSSTSSSSSSSSSGFASDLLAHEAGYDAYMTGACFAKLLHLFQIDRLNSISRWLLPEEPTHPPGIDTTLAAFKGRINFKLRDTPYVALSGPDPPPQRPGVLYITKARAPKVAWYEVQQKLMGLGFGKCVVHVSPKGPGAFVDLGTPERVTKAIKKLQDARWKGDLMPYSEYFYKKYGEGGEGWRKGEAGGGRGRRVPPTAVAAVERGAVAAVEGGVKAGTAAGAGSATQEYVEKMQAYVSRAKQQKQQQQQNVQQEEEVEGGEEQRHGQGLGKEGAGIAVAGDSVDVTGDGKTATGAAATGSSSSGVSDDGTLAASARPSSSSSTSADSSAEAGSTSRSTGSTSSSGQQGTTSSNGQQGTTTSSNSRSSSNGSDATAGQQEDKLAAAARRVQEQAALLKKYDSSSPSVGSGLRVARPPPPKRG